MFFTVQFHVSEPRRAVSDVSLLQDDAEEAVESGLILDESCSGILFAGLDRHTEDWSVEPRCVSHMIPHSLC